jgi:hypothetical protein
VAEADEYVRCFQVGYQGEPGYQSGVPGLEAGPTIPRWITSADLLPLVVDEAQRQIASVVGQKVDDGYPVVAEWSDFLARYQHADGRIEGWLLDVQWGEEALTLGPVSEAIVRLRIFGFRSMNVATGSRPAFRRTVANLFDHFRTGRMADVLELVEPPQSLLDHAAATEDRLWSSVLVHCCDLVVLGRAEVG